MYSIAWNKKIFNLSVLHFFLFFFPPLVKVCCSTVYSQATFIQRGWDIDQMMGSTASNEISSGAIQPGVALLLYSLLLLLLQQLVQLQLLEASADVPLSRLLHCSLLLCWIFKHTHAIREEKRFFFLLFVSLNAGGEVMLQLAFSVNVCCFFVFHFLYLLGVFWEVRATVLPQSFGVSSGIRWEIACDRMILDFLGAVDGRPHSLFKDFGFLFLT